MLSKKFRHQDLTMTSRSQRSRRARPVTRLSAGKCLGEGLGEVLVVTIPPSELVRALVVTMTPHKWERPGQIPEKVCDASSGTAQDRILVRLRARLSPRLRGGRFLFAVSADAKKWPAPKTLDQDFRHKTTAQDFPPRLSPTPLRVGGHHDFTCATKDFFR